jgi:hypothetical protein
MKSFVPAFAFFFAAFGLGWAIISSHIEDSSMSRDPASIFSSQGIQALESDRIHSELRRAVRIRTIFNGEQKVISFEGYSSQICKKYSEIELVFVAEGISVGGEPTTLRVKAPCEPAQDPLEMASIRLPIAQLAKERPRDVELAYSGFKEKFTFSKTADEWPQVWILSAVEFKSTVGESKTIVLYDAQTRPKDAVVLEF